MLSTRDKSLLPGKKFHRGGWDPGPCIKQDSQPNTLPASYSPEEDGTQDPASSRTASPTHYQPATPGQHSAVLGPELVYNCVGEIYILQACTVKDHKYTGVMCNPVTAPRYRSQGPYAPQGSTSLLPKLSVTSKVNARTSYAWMGNRVHCRSSEDVTLLEFTSPAHREYMYGRRKFH